MLTRNHRGGIKTGKIAALEHALICRIRKIESGDMQKRADDEKPRKDTDFFLCPEWLNQNLFPFDLAASNPRPKVRGFFAVPSRGVQAQREEVISATHHGGSNSRSKLRSVTLRVHLTSHDPFPYFPRIRYPRSGRG